MTHASKLPSQDRVVQPSVKAREGRGNAAARGKHGKHPDDDGGISGGQNSTYAGGPGERLHEKDAKRTPRGHEEYEGHLMSCPNPNSVVPDFPTSTMRRSLRWRIMQRRCWKTSLVNGAGCCRCCHPNSVGVRGATMTRFGRDRQREKLEHRRSRCSDQVVLSF